MKKTPSARAGSAAAGVFRLFRPGDHEGQCARVGVVLVVVPGRLVFGEGVSAEERAEGDLFDAFQVASQHENALSPGGPANGDAGLAGQRDIGLTVKPDDLNGLGGEPCGPGKVCRFAVFHLGKAVAFGEAFECAPRQTVHGGGRSDRACL